MLEAIEHTRIIWTDHAGDEAAVDITNEGHWWKILYQMRDDEGAYCSFMPPSVTIVDTAALAAHNAAYARMEEEIARLSTPVPTAQEFIDAWYERRGALMKAGFTGGADGLDVAALYQTMYEMKLGEYATK